VALPGSLRPGLDRDAGLAAVAKDLKGIPNPFIFPAERPASITSLARIADVPVVLSGLLVLLAVGTLAHTLVTATRRRRRDLAVLKTLGFIRPQVRGTLAWQATTLAAVALLIGLPTGIAAGRWGWRIFAGQLGVLPDPMVPPLAIFIAVPAALFLVNVVAALPGQAAARTQPAPLLSSE
jgi:ABC-type lipoprotein release transport system permease subunit